MANNGPSELPQHYGGRTVDGELVRRPASPTVPASPGRVYTGQRAYSPERTPFGIEYNPDPQSRDGVSGGLRRRPSAGPGGGGPPFRRYSQSEADAPRPSLHEMSSKKPLRLSRDDGWYRDDDRTYGRRDEFQHHPDSFERSRPPRSYRNVEAWDRVPGSASKPHFEETRGDYDLERGNHRYSREGKRRVTDDEDSDDYHYSQSKRDLDFRNLTPEERAQVLRLPWTQWMNSSVKNRKSPPPSQSKYSY